MSNKNKTFCCHVLKCLFYMLRQKQKKRSLPLFPDVHFHRMAWMNNQKTQKVGLGGNYSKKHFSLLKKKSPKIPKIPKNEQLKMKTNKTLKTPGCSFHVKEAKKQKKNRLSTCEKLAF